MSSPESCTPVAHGLEPPSAWVQRWTHLVKARGTVFDLACGHGRHMKWFASQGHTVIGVDRSLEAISAVATVGEAIAADVENGPWPLTRDGRIRQFDAVVVTNYLWRPLLPVIQESLAPGGVLIYETFASGNETVGKPSRPDFLLQPGELLRAFAGLRIVAFEDGFISRPERFVQRMAAVRHDTGMSTNSVPTRYVL
jgi:SAM-dependent methyltransferase